jgi:hypothetical protein
MPFDTIKNALKGFAGLTGCGGIADVKFIAVPRQKINDSLDRVKKYTVSIKENTGLIAVTADGKLARPGAIFNVNVRSHR